MDFDLGYKFLLYSKSINGFQTKGLICVLLAITGCNLENGF